MLRESKEKGRRRKVKIGEAKKRFLQKKRGVCVQMKRHKEEDREVKAEVERRDIEVQQPEKLENAKVQMECMVQEGESNAGAKILKRKKKGRTNKGCKAQIEE